MPLESSTLQLNPPFNGPNRVLLKSKGRYEEMLVDNAFTPGMLLQLNTAADPFGDDGANLYHCQPHGTYGGSGSFLVAIEDADQANTIWQAAVVGDTAPVHFCYPGDIIFCRIPNGLNLTAGASMISDGLGHFTSVTGVGGHTLYASLASSTAITNTAAQTIFSTNYVLPANFLQVGDVLHIRAFAQATAVYSSDTLAITLQIGSVVIYTSAAATPTANDVVYFDFEVTVASIGATGSVLATGEVSRGAAGTATLRPQILTATTLNTTIANTIGCYATWSEAQTGDSVTLDSLTIESSRIAPQKIFAIALDSVNNTAGQKISPGGDLLGDGSTFARMLVQ